MILLLKMVQSITNRFSFVIPEPISPLAIPKYDPLSSNFLVKFQAQDLFLFQIKIESREPFHIYDFRTNTSHD